MHAQYSFPASSQHVCICLVPILLVGLVYTHQTAIQSLAGVVAKSGIQRNAGETLQTSCRYLHLRHYLTPQKVKQIA